MAAGLTLHTTKLVLLLLLRANADQTREWEVNGWTTFKPSCMRSAPHRTLVQRRPSWPPSRPAQGYRYPHSCELSTGLQTGSRSTAAARDMSVGLRTGARSTAAQDMSVCGPQPG